MKSSKEIFETTDFLLGLTKDLLPSKEDNYLWMEKLWEWADTHHMVFFQRTGSLFEEDEITENKKHFFNLKKLSFTGYYLYSLPREIGHLRNLKILVLGDTMLNELPSEIGQLIKLEELYLSSNQLKELPEEIVNLVNLRQLYLDGNPSLVLSQDQKEWIIELKINNCNVMIDEDSNIDLDDEIPF